MRITNKGLYVIIFSMSFVATVMSLYYSFYGDLYLNMMDGVLFESSRAITPCDMCRYMRIAQYPIVLISGLGLLFKSYVADKKHIISLGVLGVLVSGYKVLLEYGVIELGDSSLCAFGGSVSCDTATSLFGTSISLASAGLGVFLITLLCCFLVKE